MIGTARHIPETDGDLTETDRHDKNRHMTETDRHKTDTDTHMTNRQT